MTDPIDPTAPIAPTAPTPDASASEPPAWFRAYVERTDGRFAQLGRDLGKMRRGSGAEAASVSEAAPSESAPAPVTRDELDAALRLGSIMSTLPAATQDKIKARTATQGYGSALEFAESLLGLAAELGAVSAPGNQRVIAPTGQPASGARSMTPAMPASKQELFEIKKSDPARYAQLMADDNFDPTTLPYSRR